MPVRFLKRPSLIVFILLSYGMSPSYAQDCSKLNTQTDMNICAGKKAATADARLNKIYNDIIARLKGDEDTKKLLVKAQRSWMQFRDDSCIFSSSGVKGGSIYATIYSSCIETLTENRIKDLVAYANCQEGDLSCPVPAK